MKKIQKQSGFTLVELMIVLVILGVVAAIYNGVSGSGATGSARGEEKYQFAQKATMVWTQVVVTAGVPTNPSSNILFQGSNDMLDMLVGGDIAVSSTYDSAYKSSGATIMDQGIQIITAPTAGTKGVYRMGPSTITVANGSDTREVNTSYTNTPPEEIESLVRKYDPAGAYTTSSDTSGKIRWTAIANGVHTLTVVTKVR